MILTRNKIIEEIKKENIKIKPFSKKLVGAASIDLTLSNEFRIFNNNKDVILNENSDYKKYTEFIKTKKIILKPDEFILGLTKERIKLPENICGWLYGRTRFARFGLSVHVTASFVQPGIDNRQVLEIKNVSSSNLILKEGLRICQLILERTEGRAKYIGKFRNQTRL